MHLHPRFVSTIREGVKSMSGKRHIVPSSGGKRSDHYTYLAAVREAKLLLKEKSLLYFYANAHRWSDGRCSHYSEQRICSIVSMSQKTFRQTRAKLADLGWIVVHKNGYHDTPDIELRFGRDDPNYESKEWAKWWRAEGSTEGLYINPVAG